MPAPTEKKWEEMTIQELERLIAYRHQRIVMLNRQIDQLETIIENKKI